MSAPNFRSVFMVASCAGAALGCYLVSLRVASERAVLEEVETRIVLAQRDIRLLQTEIGTRGRLAQLERWNVKVIALSAPTADQFLKGGFELARLTAPEREAPIDAPVILAAATAAAQTGGKAETGSETAPSRTPAAMMHLASLKTTPARKDEVSLEPRRPSAAAPKAGVPASKTAVGTSRPEKTDTKTATNKSAGSKMVPAAKAPRSTQVSSPKSGTKNSVAKSASVAPPAKRIKSDRRDPLAPLPDTRTTVAAAKTQTSKDSAKAR